MKENRQFCLGLIQQKFQGDSRAQLNRAQELIRESARRGSHIICLQELFSSAYFCTKESLSNFDLAEPVPGPTVSALSELARELEVVLIVPFFERRGAGVFHNSAAVIDADGSLLGVYRKMHIPDDPLYYEKYYFSPGDAGAEHMGFRVFKTRYAVIGVLICWDQWFPEAARITALLGAEIIFYPTAIGWHPGEREQFGAAQVDAWQTIQRGHAIANGVYVAAVNRVGHEDTPGTDGLQFFGHSFVCDPFGGLIAEASESEEQVLIAQCDLSLLESVRRNWPFLRDRRIDAYGPILHRYLAEPLP